MTIDRAFRRIAFIIQYEPSWFAECMSATGLFFWALFAFMTNDFTRSDSAMMLPLFGLMFGPARLPVLFTLKAPMRVFCAIINFVIWVTIFTGLYHNFKIVPAEGLIIGVALGDILTVGKFSLVSWSRQNGS